ncbi:hypothetical protein L228DRAFT_268463 [Xylona heveae TC161]|uniref:DUF7624 domain-containing protein n=1 Tax=Xylona heveae (strain CBS 132557 / TC161) TaxID=1328760 RepID=A0A165GAP2_XYLHT|nr:hypothetical protein L228DRAFT_268463 [Xylona heveae TC161]KZF21955.1 hypothetical protein L228DRAFT_268463 [Xylona heveae TC161]
MAMAMNPPIMPSPNTLTSAFSPYTDSPSSPAPARSPRFSNMSNHQGSSLNPNASSKRVSDSSDLAGPSPSTSNGTEVTEIDDLVVEAEQPEPPLPEAKEPPTTEAPQAGLTIKTDDAVTGRPRSDSDEPPQSVIHAPPGFGQFIEKKSPPRPSRSTPSPSQRSDITVKSPMDQKNGEQVRPIDTKQPVDNGSSRVFKKRAASPLSPPPISTAIAPVHFSSDRATPRAQTRQEAEELEQEKPWRQRSLSLEDIPEAQDGDHGPEEELTEDEDDTVQHRMLPPFHEAEDEVAALKTALGECWTLCNTLAGLSSIHRQRLFNWEVKGVVQEQAWKCCWQLCQKLYETRDEDYSSQVRPTLDLCREFCQALFEVRQRDDDVADSVLRVSFELNNHLYNTHDRNLPEAFRERTLDFYITLCHRLMKQRTQLAEETDSLLRACWSLAEMLFSIRQNKREGKEADEELLGSAVQACWELCDIFREGWTQVRPERGTPRPSQTTFTQVYNQVKEREPELSSINESTIPFMNPETPTTIFEDTNLSPDEAPVPNILVLGPDSVSSGSIGRRNHWSSNASTLSGQSTSSTATATAAQPEDPNLMRLKLLILKAAQNAGFQRSGSQPQSLSAFVKSLPSNSFGSNAWETQLLDSYKKLVLTDPAFRGASVPLPSARVMAADVARAVAWMGRSGQYAWLNDLFRLVFGFHVDEAETRRGVSFQT